MMLIDKFEENASATPDRVFVHFVGETVEGDLILTYDQVNRRASAFARQLSRHGIGKGDAVGILMPNSAEWLVCYFACQKIGAVSAGLNVDLTPGELEYFAGKIECRALVTTPEFHDLCRGVAGRVSAVKTLFSDQADDKIEQGDFVRDGEMPIPRDPSLTDADYLSIVFTSGTTGAAPKAALQTSGAIVQGISGYQKEIALGPDDNIMLVTPLLHGSALNWGVTLALVSGGGLVLARKFSASRFWQQADRAGATVLWTMGAIVLILLQRDETPEEQRALKKMHTIFGAATAARWRQIKDRWDLRVLDGFGMTETPGTLTQEDCFGLDDPYPCVGRPVAGVDLAIADTRTGALIGPGEIGEIVTRFGQGFAGYYKNPEAFAEAVRDGWFHTGDLAYQDTEGRVFFVDRLKSIIRRAGENISRLEVEECLVKHPDLAEVIALPKPDDILGDTVFVAVVPREGAANVTLEGLRTFCDGKLAPFKWPEDMRIVRAEDIPRTETGRVRKPVFKKVLGL